jgi:DNA-directed RNA polymerase subunit RPC12/RpoP
LVTAVNDITGDSIASGVTTEAYVDGHSRIFGEKVKAPCENCGIKVLVTEPCKYCGHKSKEVK